MKVASRFLLALSITLIISTLALAQPPVCNPDLGCPEPGAEYYVWLYDPPDWCLYQIGDSVEVWIQIINGHAVITGWRVWPADDPDGWSTARVVGPNCTVVPRE